MSWRDRLPRLDGVACPVAVNANSSATGAIGINGSIGREIFLAEVALANAIPSKRREADKGILSREESAPAGFGASHLSANSANCADSPRLLPGNTAWTDENDERAVHRWAERFARIDPDRPPVDVPLKRWQRFVDDGGLFLDSRFCSVAAALGWGPHDLFGCDRDRPFARIDQCGLLWLLNGARVIMLAEDTAAIETMTGTPQTWRRKPNQPGRVLAWELAQ